VTSGQIDRSASVPQTLTDGSKNSKLFNGHAGLDGWTDKKPESDAHNDSATSEIPSGDPGPIPESLRRQRCDHCGSQIGITSPYHWPGRPDGIWLHDRCEGPWHDSFKLECGEI